MNNEVKSYEDLTDLLKKAESRKENLTKEHVKLMSGDVRAAGFDEKNKELITEIGKENDLINYYEKLKKDYDDVIKNIADLRQLNDDIKTITDEREKVRMQERIDNLSSDIAISRLNLPDELQDDLRKNLEGLYLSRSVSPTDVADNVTTSVQVSSNDTDNKIVDVDDDVLSVIRTEIDKQIAKREENNIKIRELEQRINDTYRKGVYPSDDIDAVIDLYEEQSRIYANLIKMRKQEKRRINSMQSVVVNEPEKDKVEAIKKEPAASAAVPVTVNKPDKKDVTTSKTSKDNGDKTTVASPSSTLKSGRSLSEILYDIRRVNGADGEEELIDVTNGAMRRYNASNVKIRKSFMDRLRPNAKSKGTGNRWYVIFGVVPAVITGAINIGRKIYGKLLSRHTKDQINTLKENLHNLSDADMEVLKNQFKGATAQNMVTLAPIVEEINNAIDEYVERKYITPKRIELSKLFDSVIDSYTKFNGAHKDRVAGKADGSEKAKAAALGSAEKIARIYQLQDEITALQSNGIRGRQEDGRSIRTKRNRIGGFTSVGYSTGTDQKLAHQEAKLMKNVRESINKGNDEQALKNFMEYCILEADNTQTERKFLRGGKVSVGLREFNPLVQQLDYTPDMFVRNILTTAAVAAPVFSAWYNHFGPGKGSGVAELRDSYDKFKEYGDRLAGRKDDVEAGLYFDRARVQFDTQNAHELADDRANDWNLALESYKTSDLAHHADAEKLFLSTNDQINSLNSQLGNGSITDIQYLDAVNKINHDLYSHYGEAIDESIKVLDKYAETHPNIELNALIENCHRISDHPDYTLLGDVAVDSVKIGDEISQLSFDQLAMLESSGVLSKVAAVTPIVSTALLVGYIAGNANDYFEAQNDVILEKIKNLSGDTYYDKPTSKTSTSASDLVTSVGGKVTDDKKAVVVNTSVDVPSSLKSEVVVPDSELGSLLRKVGAKTDVEADEKVNYDVKKVEEIGDSEDTINADSSIFDVNVNSSLGSGDIDIDSKDTLVVNVDSDKILVDDLGIDIDAGGVYVENNSDMKSAKRIKKK